MHPWPLPDRGVVQGRARPAPGSETALFSMRSAVVVLLVLVFWKVSGVRYWPHTYAGAAPFSSRLVYYPEFLISVAMFGLACTYASFVLTAIRKQFALLPLFVMWAVIAGMFVQMPILTAFLAVSPYLDAWLVIVISVGVLGAESTLKVLTRTALVLIVLNIASIGVPSTSMMIGEFAGRFRGLTAHRNDLAQLAYTCALIAIAARGNSPRWMTWFILLGAIALIGASRSVQGILLLPAGIFLYHFAARIRVLKHPILVMSMVLLVSIIYAIWEQFGGLANFLAYFGRDTTFSGRDRIWALSWHLLQHMPPEGYGPGQIGSGVLSESLLLRFRLGTLFGSAHNSYLEAFLTYGWFGGALFLSAVLTGLYLVVKAILYRPDTYNALAFSLLVMGMIGGITASEKLFLPGIGWFSFVLAVVLAQPRSVTSK